MKKEDLEAILDGAPLLTVVPDSKMQESVEEFLKHPALPIVWGLMIGAKQGYRVALEDSPLINMETCWRAGVIQGTIKGIDVFYHTLLELTVPSQETTQEQ